MKVLDAAIVPTKKTFPPRAVLVILGTMLGMTVAMTWVLGKTRWDAVDASDPRKAFAVEVYTTMRARVPGLPRNGTANGNGSNGHHVGNGVGKGVGGVQLAALEQPTNGKESSGTSQEL